MTGFSDGDIRSSGYRMSCLRLMYLRYPTRSSMNKALLTSGGIAPGLRILKNLALNQNVPMLATNATAASVHRLEIHSEIDHPSRTMPATFNAQRWSAFQNKITSRCYNGAAGPGKKQMQRLRGFGRLVGVLNTPLPISRYGRYRPDPRLCSIRHFGARSGFDPVGGCHAVDAAVEGDDVGYSGGLG